MTEQANSPVAKPAGHRLETGAPGALLQAARVATRVATPVDVCGRSNTIQLDEPWHSNTQQHRMDVCGRTGTKVARTSKPLPGILEVGTQIRRPFAATKDVRASGLPGGRAATARHAGLIERLAERHEAVRAWCAANAIDLLASAGKSTAIPIQRRAGSPSTCSGRSCSSARSRTDRPLGLRMGALMTSLKRP